MGQRIRALILFIVLLGAGVLLGSSLAQWWPGASKRRTDSEGVGLQGRVRVEVLNAGGTSGAARAATTTLREHGLDVVYSGNAENFSDGHSVVLDRVGQIDVARAVADILGVREVLAEPDSNLFVDVTVRLGRDWAPSTEADTETSGTDPWWDPRRFLRKKDSVGNR